MSGYDRKIQYLDYCEQGERKFGAGFAKLENRNGLCSISLQISGLTRHGRFAAPLMALTAEGERELARLQFADGCARTCMERLPAHSLDGQGLEYDAMLGLRVPVAEGHEIRSVWGKAGDEKAHPRENASPREMGCSQAEDHPREKKAETEKTTEKLKTSEITNAANGTNAEAAASSEVAENAAAGAERSAERTAREEPAAAVIDQTEAPAAESAEQAAAPQEAVLHGDKWQQLFSIYPQIHPFDDQRVYLSISPADFVLLSAKSYPLVNNSFLLHGFYGYRHLILTRTHDRSGVRFYVGVPGSYHERERRVAVMFGFESFECRREPAREGDFGYYMIPVEI